MTQLDRKQEAQLQQTLDRLKVTPQQLFDFGDSIKDRAVSPVEWLDQNLHRPAGPGVGPLRSWHINPDRLDERLRSLLDPLGIGYCYMLTKNGQSIHEPVASFLPAYWRPHFTLGQISFPSLLRHESGLGRELAPQLATDHSFLRLSAGGAKNHLHHQCH